MSNDFVNAPRSGLDARPAGPDSAPRSTTARSKTRRTQAVPGRSGMLPAWALGTGGAGRRSAYRNGAKRGLDVAIAILIAPIVVPLVAFLALLVAVDGGKPFYTQGRVGEGGRAFRMWKLRTMVPEADAHLVRHLDGNPAAREEWRIKQKLVDDPRITPLGRLLRKSSLDELPQLWNVLRGDMSFVGPRPMMVSQKPLYPGKAYYRMRPGITGLWQVSERNSAAFAERANFDEVYDRTMSMPLDIGILFATVRVVLRGTGH